MIEVNSGDVITIFNLNRSVRVKLLGVDAPELNQAFGDVAKKHLSYLVQDKSVLVQYSGIAADGSVAGRVLLENTDIGAQMIRDGVAWFDPNNQSRLGDAEREMYQQSEQAARSERRGLWQAENPMAPWEFVKSEKPKKNSYESLKSDRTESIKQPGAGRAPELTNLTLMPDKNAPSRGPASASSPAEIQAAWASLTAASKNWQVMRPEGQNFSVLLPEEGRRVLYPVMLGDEQVDVNMHIARDGASVFAVLWITGPSFGESDEAVIENTVLKGFIRAFHKSYQRGDRGEFSCPSQEQKNISMSGYTGREFDLSSCSLPTRARAFTKVIGDQREMFFAVVFYGDEDEKVTQFVKSFTIDAPNKKKVPAADKHR